LRTEFETEISFVLEADTHIKSSVFDVMVNPIYDLAIDLGVPIAQSLVLIPDPLIYFSSFLGGDRGYGWPLS
jgi:hypothetical protein